MHGYDVDHEGHNYLNKVWNQIDHVLRELTYICLQVSMKAEHNKLSEGRGTKGRWLAQQNTMQQRSKQISRGNFRGWEVSWWLKVGNKNVSDKSNLNISSYILALTPHTDSSHKSNSYGDNYDKTVLTNNYSPTIKSKYDKWTNIALHTFMIHISLNHAIADSGATRTFLIPGAPV